MNFCAAPDFGLYSIGYTERLKKFLIKVIRMLRMYDLKLPVLNGMIATVLKELSTDPQAKPEDANDQAGMGLKAKATAPTKLKKLSCFF